MIRLRPRVNALTLPVLVGAGILVAPAAGAESPVEVGAAVAALERPSVVSAGRGIAAFSAYDGRTRRYSLQVVEAGAVRTVKVAPRAVPFDVSIGTDGRGRPALTYGTCRTETKRIDPLTGFPFWPDRRGCKVESLDLKSGAVKALPTQRAKGGGLWLPVQHRGDLVYARLRDLGRHRKHLHRYRFEIVRRDRDGRTSRLRGGPGALADVDRGAGGDLEGFGSGATSLSFDGNRLGFTWVSGDRKCPDVEDGPGQYATSVWLGSLVGAQRRVARNCNSGTREFTRSASLTSDGLAWAESGPNRQHIDDSRVASVSMSTSNISRRSFANQVTTGFGTTLSSLAIDGASAWYVEGLDGKFALVKSTWP